MKDNKATDREKKDQELRDFEKSLKAGLEEMESMNFEAFKKRLIENFKELYEGVFTIADQMLNERERIDGCMDVIGSCP